MKRIKNRTIILMILIGGMLCCKQPYIPPNIKGNYNFLVVDGLIINGNVPTTIKLSRAENINDSSYYPSSPETGASVSVVGSNGDAYPLNELVTGTYEADSLSLNPYETYQLKIITSNGNVYLSDSTVAQATPPIDSINWQLTKNGCQIYANTHDPTNSTSYYIWQYNETWEYHAAYGSAYQYINSEIVLRDSTQQVYKCWQSDQSTNLILGTSANLVQDVIYEQPLIFIPSTSQKLGVEYSIQVNQYAINQKAYNFWLALQKNTEQLGSLFDAQPSQLTGNIHNVANANEPVLGYISITSLQQKRIFISIDQLSSWSYVPLVNQCQQILVANNPDSFAFYFGSGYVPLSQDYSSVGLVGYYSATFDCADCTSQGGTNVKPVFWPH